MQIADTDTEFEEIVGEILGHLLGQRRDQHPFVTFGTRPDLADKVVDLTLGRLQDDLRIEQAGRTDDLLDHPVGTGHLVWPRCRREIHRLADACAELLPTQRPVVHGAGQPEAVLDQVAFAGHVAFEHPADLWDRDVRLVDDQQEVVREVVEQRVRRRAGGTPVNMPGVVLDTRTETDLAHHFDVIGGAHPQPLGLQQLSLALHLGEPLGQLRLNARDRPLHPFRAGDVVGGGEDEHIGRVANDLPGHRMQIGQPFDLVPEHLDPDCELLIGGKHLDGIAADAERPTGEGQVVAGVLDVDEPAQQPVAFDLLPDPQPDHAFDVLLRGAQTVDAAHARHDHHVPTREQAHRGRMAQPLDLLVDRRVLLDVGVGLGDIGLWLVVVVVRHEVLDGIVRQQLPELVGQLRGEGLVGRHHQCRALQLLNEPRGGRRLAGTGRAEQDDVGVTGTDAAGKLRDRGRLVAGRLEVRHDPQRRSRTLDVLTGAIGSGAHVSYNTTEVRQFPSGLRDGRGKTLPHLSHLVMKIFRAAAVVHEDVGHRAAGGVRRLVGHPRQRLLPRKPPIGQAGKADLAWRHHDDDHVVAAGQAGLDEQRHVVHDHRVGRSIGHATGRLRADQRMCDRLKAAAGGGVREHDSPERLPIEAAVGAQHLRPELVHDGPQPRCTDGDDLPGDRVRIDDDGTVINQQPRHRALARADPTGQPHPQHGADSPA